MFDLGVGEWGWLAIAALGIGIAKSGLSGFSMVHVLVFAAIFPARESTGIVLPMLIIGDICAILIYRRHTNWQQVRKMLPPAVLGVVVGWLAMHRIDPTYYRALIGFIILGLAVLQLLRYWSEAWQSRLPHSIWFAWCMGFLVGTTTMLANGAGPVFSLYLIALGVPKMEFVGTSAGFFLLLNLLKVPFSFQLGLIHEKTLGLNLLLSPLIVVGLFLGQAVVKRLPQKVFDVLILVFAAAAAIWLLA
jgi:uncharacterized membrane protein YfcA